MIKLRMRNPIDVLINRYESLVEDASRLDKLNPEMSFEKLKQAAKIQIQIEELKISKNN